MLLRIRRQFHFHEAVECYVIGDAFYRNSHFFLGLSLRICDRNASEIAIGPVLHGVANLVVKYLLPFDPTAFGVDRRSNDEMSCFSVFDPNYLGHFLAVSEHVGRFQRPAGF